MNGEAGMMRSMEQGLCMKCQINTSAFLKVMGVNLGEGNAILLANVMILIFTRPFTIMNYPHERIFELEPFTSSYAQHRISRPYLCFSA